MTLGTRIKQIRKSQGLTQQQLADSLFIVKRTVEKYENNEIDISINTLRNIAKALNCTMLNLLIDDPSEILSIIKDYYNLEEKTGCNIEKDFSLVIDGFVNRYKK